MFQGVYWGVVLKMLVVNETCMYEKSANKESDTVLASGSCDVPKVSYVNNYR